MRYWLVKSEPGQWSWNDHWTAPKSTAPWDGVRNHQANNNLKAMNRGDRALFYHSVKQRAIVGVLEVVRTWYPDPEDPSGRFGMVDFKAIEPMARPVTLAQIKAEPRLARVPLIRQSRLSVMPIEPDAWRILCQMGGIEP